ncbi:MAG: NAD(P)-binding protein [Actinobacteria bacterium]|nr:NAD(P)-binding protein [Actinomycetota bacterium]
MAETVIVGAGLSGLVAAINLVREGRDVLVLERESRIGGSSLYHPGIAGTPINHKAYAKFAGIDLSPAGGIVETGKICVDDKSASSITGDVEGPVENFLVEQGPRSTSINTFLYDLAVKEGVKVEFNHPVMKTSEFAQLPPDSIISTGLYFEGYDALHIPYMTSFHFIARKTIDESVPNNVSLYFGDFTTDYAYTSSMNGILMAHVFQRFPIGHDNLKVFEELMHKHEGFEFKEWLHFTFPVPSARRDNPRLLAGNKILSGSLAGCIEPFMFFGLHGAFVSGKIAAIAVSDKETAYQEFLKCNRLFMYIRFIKNATKDLRYPMLKFALNHSKEDAMSGAMGNLAAIMPGYANYKQFA